MVQPRSARASSGQKAATIAVEPLEGRVLFSYWVSGTVTVRLFNDRNGDGVRNRNEVGLANWPVAADSLQDAGGTTYRGNAATNAQGYATFTDYYDLYSGSGVAAVITVGPNNRFRCTNQIKATGGWSGSARPSIEFGLTDIANYTGRVIYDYRLADGTRVKTPLAQRIVYEDFNGNGRRDSGEQAALTDLDGTYTMRLRSGRHRLVTQVLGGWGPIRSGGLSTVASVLPGRLAPTFSTMMIRPTVINVVAAYTPAAVGSSSDSSMRRYVQGLFNDANRVYANSDTNVRVNLVTARRTSYSESGSIETDLDRLHDGNDDRLDDVQGLRNSLHADLAMLLTSGDKTDGNVVGLAYQFDRGRGSDELAYSVVALQGQGDSMTIAHEIGHNLGAGHDEATASSDGDHLLASYAHGYRFRGNDGRMYKDVMAYGSGTTLPFFSSPRFRYLGKPMGTADAADNARMIRELAPEVAGYR